MVRRSPARGRRPARPNARPFARAITRPTVRPTVATTVLSLIALLGISASCTPQTAVSPGRAAPPAAAPTKYVLLTFDDGPDAKYTPQILEILKSYDAKATFFEVGQNVVRQFGLRAIVNLFTAVGVTVLLLVLGVDFPLLWGILTFFLSFVPYVGLFLALTPAVVGHTLDLLICRRCDA